MLYRERPYHGAAAAGDDAARASAVRVARPAAMPDIEIATAGRRTMTDTPSQVRRAVDGDVTSLLSKEDRTRGDLRVGGCVRVDGVVCGDIEPVSDHAAVIIGAEGFVEGNIHVRRARVEGRIYGSIRVDGHLDVTSSAIIEGDLAYNSISVEPGAWIDGRATCTRSEAAAEEPPVRAIESAE